MSADYRAQDFNKNIWSFPQKAVILHRQTEIYAGLSFWKLKMVQDEKVLFVAELVVSDSSDETFFTTIPAVVPTGLYYLHLYCEDEIITSKLYVY